MTSPSIVSSLCLSVFVASFVLGGCSEANDSTDGSVDPLVDAGHDAPATHDGTVVTPPPPVTDATSIVTHEAATPPGDTGLPPSDASLPPPGDATTPPSTVALVLNEISGKGTDYVELYNAGTTAVSLAGWGITEAKDDDAGAPGKVKNPAVFAAGASLPAGGYALAYGAPKDGGAPIGPCTASVCVQATWNISTSNGATVYLVNPADASVASEAFPKNVTGSGQSWGRLPNGTGAFAINTQTPGATNSGP